MEISLAIIFFLWQDHLPIYHGEDPDFMEIDRCAFAGPSKNPAIRNTNKSKVGDWKIFFSFFFSLDFASLLHVY